MSPSRWRWCWEHCHGVRGLRNLSWALLFRHHEKPWPCTQFFICISPSVFWSLPLIEATRGWLLQGSHTLLCSLVPWLRSKFRVTYLVTTMSLAPFFVHIYFFVRLEKKYALWLKIVEVFGSCLWIQFLYGTGSFHMLVITKKQQRKGIWRFLKLAFFKISCTWHELHYSWLFAFSLLLTSKP